MSVELINSATSQTSLQRMPSMKKLIFISISAIIIAGIGYAYYLFQKPHQGIADEPSAFKLDAVSLVNDYDKDEKAANEKYLGKVVEVKGVVSEKVKDENGKYNITLQAADLSGVGCEFDTKFQGEIKNLQEGQEVCIKGVCTGVLMDVVLVDCVLLNEKQK
jgi:hypothetical protein